MTLGTLLKRGLQYHRRTHLGVLAGAAIGVATLAGALVVGDSVRVSLRDRALQRLGATESAMATGDRFFLSDLEDRLRMQAGDGGGRLASALVLPGTAARQDGAARANHVTMLGVSERTWPAFAQWTNRAGTDALKAWQAGETVLINEALAIQLRARENDELVLRVRKPGAMSQEAVISPQEDRSVALRVKVGRVLSGKELGDFGLTAGSTAPLNAFVPLEFLAGKVDLARRANVVLCDGGDSQGTNTAALNTRLEKAWRIEDAGLSIRTNGTAWVEVSSSRVFLEDIVARALPKTNAVHVFTYLANLIESGTGATPYSMITAADGPYVPADLKADEIVVNAWLAQDLQLKAGDSVRVSYYLADSGSRLEQRTNTFRVRSVAPLEGIYADRSLMPEFPGLAKAERTQDWDAGFPLTYTIRPTDEDYWKQHRGTPKAFISLAAGQAIWSNRFGTLTSLRYPVSVGTSAAQFAGTLRAELSRGLRPADLGFQFENVRFRALRGAAEAQDFGQLFLGFSFFLVLAALLLMALIFRLGLEQRVEEIGILLATGFRRGQVMRLILGEGLVLILAGGVIGMLGGLAYAKAMLTGLTTIWRDATGGSLLFFHANGSSLGIGLVSGTVAGIVVLWLGVRRLAARPARELLAGDFSARVRSGRRWVLWLAGASVAGALAIGAWAIASGQSSNPGAFFGAGMLMLVAGVAGTAAWLDRLAPGRTAWQARPGVSGAERTRGVPTVSGVLGVRSCARRPSRSLAVVGLMASGVFLIASVGVFRLDATRDEGRRDSGTGGYGLIGESALPVVQDLNTPRGRETYGLEGEAFRGKEIVAFRVREGDEASCLNLSRAQRPRVLGVDPGKLAGRFTFTAVAPGMDRKAGWALLNAPHAADEVLAVGDANSIQWAMGKKPGETIEYTDEQGRPFRIRIVGAVANSILQGALVVNEREFITRFPGQSGYRWFLVDAPTEDSGAVASGLTRSLQDLGFEAVRAADRLNQFNAVQNTYLGTFQLLGGLGLLLGSAGIGLVLFRNVLERRGELGLLTAVGFRAGQIRAMLLAEHMTLLGLGLGLGLLSAAVAVLPGVLAAGTHVPWVSLGVTFGAVLLNGIMWVVVAGRVALKGNLLAALRNE